VNLSIHCTRVFLKMARKYEMRQRAERQSETRQRIVEATVALHEESGMLNTTISDIARRAGVERATVYRHFPDERSLLTACTGHFYDMHPMPEPERWRGIADPEERLRTGLREVFAYHRRTERMLSRTLPELPRVPVLQEVIAPRRAQWMRAGDVLADPWGASGPARELVTAAIGHAVAFPTWQSLVRQQGLDDARAVEMLVIWVRCLAHGDVADDTAGTS
jgi:AcrR family transcriptional regulator